MKGHLPGLLALSTVCLFIAAGCVAPAATAPPTATPDPFTHMKTWVDANNKGDVDALLALFTDDIKYVAEHGANDKADLRGLFEWLVSMDTKMEIKECRPIENGAVCTYLYSDGCTAAYGATEGLLFKVVYNLQDGKIQRVTGATEGDEWTGYDRFTNSVLIWARTNRRDEAIKFTQTREYGPTVVRWCQEYAASLK